MCRECCGAACEGPPRNAQDPAKVTEPRSAVTVARSDNRKTECDGLAVQLARRYEAALRLPPLECGCQDPETQTHLAGKCPYRRAA